MIAFTCPFCQKGLKCKDTAAGKQIACPGCNERVRIPQPGSTANSSYRRHKQSSSSLLPVLLVCLVVVLFGGGALLVLTGKKESKGGNKATSAGKVLTEADARDQLKLALDAWKAQVWKEELPGRYPQLDFVDADYTDEFHLFRFDIGLADPNAQGWWFKTELVFQLKNGKDVRYHRIYQVQAPDERGVWRITVFFRGSPFEVR